MIAPVIKQELGVNHLSESGHSASPLVKQEPGGYCNPVDQNSLCAYSSHQQQQQLRNEACSGVSFPSLPLNLNFMADIEDIVPSASPGRSDTVGLLLFYVLCSTELTINSIQQELSSFDGPSVVKGSHRRGSLVKEEEVDWEPPLWKQQYENIRTMRSKRDAPVDKYGCFMNAEKEVPPEVCMYVYWM